ncbi:hypothetical protein FQA39_LY04660 [Lamprigera yunnana]|nr:hypothetical protein FQA39_LY04660 [Lamprigera yunnana]
MSIKSTTEIIEEEPPPKRRKGIRNDTTYKKNVIKKSRVKGTEHTNHKGVVVNFKSIGQPCNYLNPPLVIFRFEGITENANVRTAVFCKERADSNSEYTFRNAKSTERACPQVNNDKTCLVNKIR